MYAARLLIAATEAAVAATVILSLISRLESAKM
jgi:hypothetical protein